MPCPFNFSRRSFLSGLAASAAVGAAPGAEVESTSLPLESTDSLDHPGALDFHGEHQQGIINPPAEILGNSGAGRAGEDKSPFGQAPAHAK